MQWLQLRCDCPGVTFMQLPFDAQKLHKVAVALQSLCSCNHCINVHLPLVCKLAGSKTLERN